MRLSMTPWFSLTTGAQPLGETSFLSGPMTDRYLRIRLGNYGLDPDKTARQLIEQADKIAPDALPRALIGELAELRQTIGEEPFYDALVRVAMSRDFWSIEALIKESARVYLPDLSPTASSLVSAYRSGDSINLPNKQTPTFHMASSSSAPPPRRSEPPSAEGEDAVQKSEVNSSAQSRFSWENLSLDNLKTLLTGDRPQDIRKAALAVLFDRYRQGQLEALFTIVACAELSEAARIKLHDMVGGSDITFRHLQRFYESAHKDPSQLRSLFFAFRSLANRVNDLVAQEFEQLIAAGEMIPLSANKIRYFNEIISNLFDGDLSDWAKEGSEDAAVELQWRYLTLKDSHKANDREDAQSALVELADTARHNAYAMELLFKAGDLEATLTDSLAWGEIDGLARETEEAADALADAVEAGNRGNYYTSLLGAAVENPYAALRLCEVAQNLHDAGEFHQRDQILIDILDINLVRYREFAQTDSRAVEALVRLHRLGAKQARRTLEFVAPHNPEAAAALQKLNETDRSK